jgi:hypothetical protein
MLKAALALGCSKRKRKRSLTDTFTRERPVYWSITVPNRAGPGSVFRVQIPDGRLVDVTVPDGVGPGDIIQFEA